MYSALLNTIPSGYRALLMEHGVLNVNYNRANFHRNLYKTHRKIIHDSNFKVCSDNQGIKI
jgi:hypothetical protein